MWVVLSAYDFSHFNGTTQASRCFSPASREQDSIEILNCRNNLMRGCKPKVITKAIFGLIV